MATKLTTKQMARMSPLFSLIGDPTPTDEVVRRADDRLALIADHAGVLGVADTDGLTVTEWFEYGKDYDLTH